MLASREQPDHPPAADHVTSGTAVTPGITRMGAQFAEKRAAGSYASLRVVPQSGHLLESGFSSAESRLLIGQRVEALP
jgi:hypothetical protein